jgi:hypothetical protein
LFPHSDDAEIARALHDVYESAARGSARYSMWWDTPQVGCCPGSAATTGEVGVDPFEAPVLDRHDVVLDRLDEPKTLQFGQFSGFAAARSLV